MRTHFRHVLMCTGPRCTEDGLRAEDMFQQLGAAIDARPDLRVKRTRTQCMLACKTGGPVLVVYPEGIWYRCHDQAALEHIVEEHLQHGREVSELVFHRLGTGDVETASGAPAASAASAEPTA